VSKKKVTPIDYIKLYQEVFGTPQGQLVLMDICKRARVMSPFPMRGDLELDLSFCEGQRQLALDLLLKVNYDLNKLLETRELNQLEVSYE
jgi:hypothetical protein